MGVTLYSISNKANAIKAFVGLFSLLLLFVFQNCAEPLEDTGLSGFSTDTPFAFDAKVDTLAHLSCSQMNSTADKSAYFSFKLAALREGSGVRLTPEFKKYIGYKSTYSAAEILANSEKNVGATMQLGLKSRGNFIKYGSFGVDSATGAKMGKEVNTFLSRLDSLGIVSELYDSDNYVHYFSKLPGLENRNMETSISLVELQEGALRNNMTDYQLYLSLTYTIETAKFFDEPFSDLANPDDQVYGSGLKLQFGGAHSRLVDRVYEYNLAQPEAPAEEWVCPPHLKYRVSKLISDCAPAADDPTGNPDFSMVRQILDPEADDWYINEAQKCISRKKTAEIGSCYGKSGQVVEGTQHLSVCYRAK